MDNDLQLSAGEAIYMGPIREMSWQDYQVRKHGYERLVMASKATSEKPPQQPRKKGAGRKKLDEAGKARSAVQRVLYKATLKAKRAEAKLERQREAAERKALAEERRRRKQQAAIEQENDQAVANSKKEPTAPVAYTILSTSALGVRTVRIDAKTIIEVSPGKDVEHAVLRVLNRKQVIF